MCEQAYRIARTDEEFNDRGLIAMAISVGHFRLGDIRYFYELPYKVDFDNVIVVALKILSNGKLLTIYGTQ